MITQGLHEVSHEDYFKGEGWKDAASYSKLKLLENSSPAHLYHALLNPREKETAAMLEGRVTDVAVLTPDLFDEQFSVGGKCEAELGSGARKGEACGGNAVNVDGDGHWYCGKHNKDGRADTHPGIISQGTYDQAGAIVTSLHAHPLAEELLWKTKGSSQKSLFWTDPTTGINCRGRLDRMASWHGTTVIDLKKTVCASPSGFPWEIAKYGYHIQAAMYLDGLDTISEALTGEREPLRYMIIAVEGVAPYAVGVYEVEPQAIEEGRQHYRAAMDKWAECVESNSWPAYGQGHEMIDIPAHKYKYLLGGE